MLLQQNLLQITKRRALGWKGGGNLLLSYNWEEIIELGMHTLTCSSMCVCVCVVLPRRLDSVGHRFSAERAPLTRSAPLPRAEAPKASRAAPMSPEEAKQFIRLIEFPYKIHRDTLLDFMSRKSHISVHQQLQTTKLAKL